MVGWLVGLFACLFVCLFGFVVVRSHLRCRRGRRGRRRRRRNTTLPPDSAPSTCRWPSTSSPFRFLFLFFFAILQRRDPFLAADRRRLIRSRRPSPDGCCCCCCCCLVVAAHDGTKRKTRNAKQKRNAGAVWATGPDRLATRPPLTAPSKTRSSFYKPPVAVAGGSSARKKETLTL